MDVITKTTQQALRLLDAVRAQYKVILPTGEEYGVLEIKPKEEPKVVKRRPGKYPHGELTAHATPFLQGVVVGDVAQVPIDKYDPEILRGSVASNVCMMWGRGNFRTGITATHIEVLRVG